MLARRRSRSGQAIAELLPAMTIFFMLLGGAMAYYKVVRTATIKQEVVRNLLFAKINNSGTLTSTTGQIDSGGGGGENLTGLRLEGANTGAVEVVKNNQNDFISSDTSCFTVIPAEASVGLPLGSLLLGGDLGVVNVSTFAVMYRNAGGARCP